MFALLLNFPWEFMQVPLFAKMANAPHWEAVQTCARATLGAAVIMLIAFWTVSACSGSRRWISTAPRVSRPVLFISTGVAITVVIEWLAQRDLWIDGWRYSALMPVLPFIGVGLAPLLQWIVLPVLVAWIARRQMPGRLRSGRRLRRTTPR